MKKKLLIVLAIVMVLTLLLTSLTFAYPSHKTIEYGYWSKKVSNWLEMEEYHDAGTGEHASECEYEWGASGPSAGVSIGRYYRDDYDKDYGNLPDDDEMYDVLYEEIPASGCFAEPFYYGYGFVEMTQDPDQNNDTNDGYYNFGYVYDVVTTENSDDIFDDIVNAIDNGWPIALSGWFYNVYEESGDPPGGNDWPPQSGPHYIAIKGYSYWQALWPLGRPPTDRRIECTDNYCGSDSLWFEWDHVVDEGIGLEINIIKDEIPEDFEWGSDETPLSADGNNIGWTVYGHGDGDSVAEIDHHFKHSDIKSARFYYDGDAGGEYNYVMGHYPENEPIWRGFWLMTDGDAEFYTRTGDGEHSILVRVRNSDYDGKLQYYDGGWKDAGFSLDPYDWYFIEFRAIKWDYPYKYAIYVDGNYVKGGVSMREDTYYDGLTVYYTHTYEGSFWIDDIPSSWW